MRQLVQDYLEKPDPKLLARMTTEESRYVAKSTPAKKKRKAKNDNSPEPEAEVEAAEKSSED